MEDKGIGQKEFALKMDMSEELAEELIQGIMLLTPEIAARLEAVLGIPTEFWNKLEKIGYPTFCVSDGIIEGWSPFFIFCGFSNYSCVCKIG